MSIEYEMRSVMELARRRVKEAGIATPERSQELAIEALEMIETLAQAIIDLSEKAKP